MLKTQLLPSKADAAHVYVQPTDLWIAHPVVKSAHHEIINANSILRCKMLISSQHDTGEILTVKQLNSSIRESLESGFACVWVEGEISDCKRPGSGHIYLTLKDEAYDSQIRCAMFRHQNRQLDFAPESGLKVLIRAKVSVYEPRGDYQLIIEHMEESGLGTLQRAFEALKKRLHADGLFDPKHKQPLPALPKCIGIITSPTGAAVRDIITTLKRRYPATPVIIYPSLVQGEQAAAQLCNALAIANQRAECDVLIIGRGGGSLEDLWPFNEETVARAIFSSTIPTISAVGHEIDFTIADLVADVRAPTPTAAAEYVSPEWQSQIAELTQLRQRLINSTTNWLRQQSQRIDFLGQRLRDPRQQLREIQLRLQHTWQSLHYQMRNHLRSAKHDVQQLVGQLQTLSPLATLSRGYSITRLTDSKTIVRSKTQVKPNDRLTVQVSDGEIDVIVNQ